MKTEAETALAVQTPTRWRTRIRMTEDVEGMPAAPWPHQPNLHWRSRSPSVTEESETLAQTLC